MKALITMMIICYCLTAAWIIVTYQSIQEQLVEARLEGIKIGKRLMGGY